MSFPETAEDPETAIALDALVGMFYGRVFGRFEHWRRIRRSYPQQWQEACGLSESAMYVTPDELRELTAEFLAILFRFNERLVDPSLRPPGSRLVEVLAAAYPVEFGQPTLPSTRHARQPGRWSVMRELLRNRNARRYLIGQSFSLFGDTAMFLAMGIWVKVLTGSNGEAGLVFFAFGAAALLSPLAGMVVDRLPRRPLLFWSNLGGGAVVLLLLLVHGKSQLWLIYLVAFLYGLAYTFLSAGQTALLKVMLPDELIGDARGMLSTVREGLRLFGPLAGAGLFALAGGGVVAVVDASTFVIAADKPAVRAGRRDRSGAARTSTGSSRSPRASATSGPRSCCARWSSPVGSPCSWSVSPSRSASPSSARACTAHRPSSASSSRCRA